MPKEIKLAELVQTQRSRVIEDLDAGGHAGVNENTAEPLDWIRCLMEANADIALECRYDISDPETALCLRRKLAFLIATCEAWDAQLN